MHNAHFSPNLIKMKTLSKGNHENKYQGKFYYIKSDLNAQNFLNFNYFVIEYLIKITLLNVTKNKPFV